LILQQPSFQQAALRDQIAANSLTNPTSGLGLNTIPQLGIGPTAQVGISTLPQLGLGQALQIPGMGLSLPQAAATPQTRLYIGSLHYEITEAQVRALFSPFGDITKLDMSHDPLTGKSKVCS